ncbi:hypothetical protein D9M68_475060 [compost metagenome]|uniref:Uncharacterized protein n=1 Tax=Pseudomonas jinjuensis TaxID=198616 RepID=A0A1H0HJN8_9PSED|nr:hypothetical protein [Pseudomonas jinjuensis]SDO19392.1 hypothetical protein SAMN05216193_108265 [Pseudomonas jinjuensis]
MSANIAIRYYAFAGIAVAVLLNVLLRAVIKVGGLPANLLVAALIGAGMAFCFARIVRREASLGERWRLLAIYGGTLALCYLWLVGMAAWKNPPGPAALLLYLLNYLCYPLAAWWFFRPSVMARFLPR